MVPSGRGRGRKGGNEAEPKAVEKTVIGRHQALTWATRLKRVFAIEITSCSRCGGALRVIASIEEASVIARILEHLAGEESSADRFAPEPVSRGPPEGMLPI